ncbi:MAG: alpha/beta hydrolase [Verrucomicrobia bacterium]|nr:alpha/beta hydrolase [Verrucomicrobiota bacterium]
MFQNCIALLVSATFPCLTGAAELVEVKNVAYRAEGTVGDGIADFCKLDFYRPAEGGELPCLLWFHGGGLTAGSKDESVETARALARQGILVASVNYRLSPKARYPAYIDDAAAAFAWVSQHAGEHRGDKAHIFVAGHSAGGYLALMLGNDKRWLGKYGLKPADIAGVISLSGQMVTHFTIRAERGMGNTTIVVDEDAPLHYAGQACGPQLILYAEQDMAMRAEENILYLAARKEAGQPQVCGGMVKGHNHGSIGENISAEGDPVRKAMAGFVSEIVAHH